ncbi:MAG: protein kinase domain-containing protein, partial [Gemmataceae bacterium]
MSKPIASEQPTLAPAVSPASEPATLSHVASPQESATLAPSSSIADSPGVVVIPGYEILGELGRGGMGVVYQARDLRLKRRVALKMVLAGGHAGEQELARFRTEAEAVARLQHPGIVQIHEVGVHDGLPFFCLEFCPGGSLDRKLDGTPLPPNEAAALVEKLARAMHAAHQKGVIHRDLKPANVLLAEDGTPKITDFGLAKKLDETGQTNTGSIMGTPSYMAPEQAGGSKSIGPACDVYALGAILYELLTGRPPFKAATSLDTILQALSDEPVPPRRLQPKVPRDVETICLKCLRKEPSKRYASAADLADELRRFRAGEPIRARPVGAAERAVKWVKRRPASAALMAVLLLAALGLTGGGVWFTLKLDKERQRAEDNAIAEGKERARAEDKQREADAAKQDALTQLDRAEMSLYVNRIGRADRETDMHDLLRSNVFLDECRRDYRNWEWRHLRQRNHYTVPLYTFQGNENILSNVVFSPDGRLLAGVRAGSRRPGIRGLNDLNNKLDEVKLWDAGTGVELLSLKGHTRTIWNVAISPDGSRLASASDDKTVRVWDARTGAKLLPPMEHLGPVWSVVFSPDGGRLASVSGFRVRKNKRGEVKVWDARTGIELFSVKEHIGPDASVAFSPDGSQLAGTGDDQTVKVWDARTGVKIHSLKGHTGDVRSVAFSRDGICLASTSDPPLPANILDEVKLWDPAALKESARISEALANTPGEVKVWDLRKGIELFSLKGPKGPATRVVFNADGSRLTTANWDGTMKVWETRSGVEVLSIKTGPVGIVVFSPDGSRIAGAGSAEANSFAGTVKLWDARTGTELLSLKGHEGPIVGVVFSPDGSFLASASLDGTVKVWGARTHAEDLSLKGHTGSVRSVVFSPDSSRLASGGDDGTVKVWDARTSAEIFSLKGHTGVVFSVAYSPDGSRLVSASNQPLNFLKPADVTKPAEVKMWDAHTGVELRSFKGHAGPIPSLVFSPDGRLLAGACNQPVNLPNPADVKRKEVKRAEVKLHEIKMWDAATGVELRSLPGHALPITSVAFSPDGKR